jgi:hypothetical protein
MCWIRGRVFYVKMEEMIIYCVSVLLRNRVGVLKISREPRWNEDWQGKTGETRGESYSIAAPTMTNLA